MNTVTDVVQTVETVAEKVHEAIPYASSLAGIVAKLFPQFGLVILGLKIADNVDLAVIAALNTFMEKNGGDPALAQAQFLAHINPRMPNSPLLSGKPSDPATAADEK